MFIVLALIILLVTKSKMKKPLDVESIKTFKIINIASLVLMISTTGFNIFSSAEKSAMSMLYTDDTQSNFLLILLTAITILVSLIFTIIISVQQLRIIKKLNDHIPVIEAEPKEDSVTEQTNNVTNTNQSQHAFLIAIATSPVLFIIRMLTQTTEHIDAGIDSWKSYDRVFVPGNIKAIMVILLIASIFLSNYFQKKHNDANKKSSTIALLNIMNVVIGFLIIIVEG